MNTLTALKVSTFFLILGVIAIVALMILFYFSQKEIAKLSVLLKEKQKTVNVSAIVANMLDNMTFTEAVASVGKYGEEYVEPITAELWKQYHERQARDSVCEKK